MHVACVSGLSGLIIGRISGIQTRRPVWASLQDSGNRCQQHVRLLWVPCFTRYTQQRKLPFAENRPYFAVCAGVIVAKGVLVCWILFLPFAFNYGLLCSFLPCYLLLPTDSLANSVISNRPFGRIAFLSGLCMPLFV